MGTSNVGDRWKDRRLLAACLGAAILGFPVLCAVGLTVAAEVVVARPTAGWALVAWWLGVLALSTLAFLVAERAARRAMPLKLLLRMGLTFPDRSPKRLAVAWRAASVRDLGRKVAEAREQGIADEPTEAAAKIVTLAAALSAHDRSTRGHSERVRALTDMISEELHLGPADRERLRWSALLHDIGKLAVHPDVLNKQEALSDPEWDLIRLHPLEGAKLTMPLAPWLGAWANTIAEHHERYDGKGYPHGLAGKAISHGGRIVAVADSYDVMTSARSYKRPIGPEAARRELAACAGSQFDPDVVRAFLGVSVWRLRFATPLSWVGSFAFARLGNVARLAEAGGRTLATGLVAAGGVVGFAIAAPTHHAPPGAPARSSIRLATTPLAGTAAPRSSAGTRTAGAATGAAGQGTGGATPPTTGHATGTQAAGTATRRSATTTATPPRGTTTKGTGTTKSKTGSPTATPPTTRTTTTPKPRTTSATTSTPHKRSATPPTTTTTTSSTTTTTTTTTTQPPPVPPAPPTNVRAAGSCQLIVLGPEIAVTWTPSGTSSVTSYVVLRSSNGSTFSAVATVSPGTTSYTDTSVGISTAYWYKVEAVSAGGSATSAAASARTPPLCL
jgi:putative nucleotidyltransferase with HDIG domain